MNNITAFENAIGYVFQDKELIQEALTHSSYVASSNQKNRHSYERLEFLGDRVLGLVIAQELLKRFPDEKEGDIAKRHTALVCRDALVMVAKKIDLHKRVILSASEQQSGGAEKPAILADVCEAVIAALYMDGGIKEAEKFILHYWQGMIEKAKAPPRDMKSALQEKLQALGAPLPEYRLIERKGPDHAPEFIVAVFVEGQKEPVEATARSKQQAEKKAARLMLEKLERES